MSSTSSSQIKYLSLMSMILQLLWLQVFFQKECLGYTPVSVRTLQFNFALRKPQRNRNQNHSFLSLSSMDQVNDKIDNEIHSIEHKNTLKVKGRQGAISMHVNELAKEMQGWGRARLVWDMYRIGVDPLVHYRGTRLERLQNDSDNALEKFMAHLEDSEDNNEEILNLLPIRRKTQGLGVNALKKLEALYESYGGGLEGATATLSYINTSSDGTTKLLIKLHDGLEVETVIIPWYDKGWSTVCISSQVGCLQGCKFCATGKMGKLRSLTSDEILSQFFFALKICRLSSNLPKLSNVVFMGMGEPADNVEAVCKATEILTDVDLFHMAQTKVVVSTVAPTPEAFKSFKDAPCALAWSVHAVNDDLRRKLVPTTKHTMHELRQGLIDALSLRPKRLRATMLEIALIKDINDHPGAAAELAEFSKVLIDSVPGIKLAVNLIPFNDIGHPTYEKPSKEAIKAFRNILRERNIICHVRTTRGDDESAACGQLTTKKQKESQISI